VLKKIGAGAFGEIYSGKNIITNELVAIKVERVDSKKQVLKLEVAVLKKLQACPYVCRFITCGRFNEYNYMIMELLGDNISELRRRQPDGKFSMGTSLKLAMQMLKALEAIHELGYIHRDVKPSNFAMGLSGVKRHATFLIDFGLARRYVLTSGEVRPPRDSTGFRGTARYASINSHLSKDLGRRDDIWSIFYMLIEFVQGQLPWRKLKDKDQIGEMKIKYNTPDIVKDMPPHFLSLMKHIKTLNYADRPDYNYMQSLLDDLYHTIGCDDHTPFDWEVNSTSTSHTSAIVTRSAPSTPGPPIISTLVLSENHNNNNNAHPIGTASPVSQRVQHEGTKPISVDENDPHSEGHSHPSRKDSSNNNNNQSEESGSWNQKSSPREKAEQREHADSNGNPRQADIHIKIIEKDNSGSPRETENHRPPPSGASLQMDSSKYKKPALCAKCTLM